MTPTRQRRIALSAALGLGVVAVVLVLPLAAVGALDAGTGVGLLVAVVLYGVLVFWRLRHPGVRRSVGADDHRG